MRNKSLIAVFLLAANILLYSQDRPDALEKYKQGKYKEAVSICLVELEDMPSNMDSYSVLCWSLVRLKRYEEALDYGKKGIAVSRHDIRIIEILGETYYYLGKNLEALKYFEEYSVLAPAGDRIDIVYFYMGEIFIRIGEYNHADIALSTAVYHSPNIARWWSRLGYAREMAKDYPYAEEAYEKALMLNPSYTEAERGKERIAKKLENG